MANKNDKQEHQISILNGFMTCGLEEFISDSSVYITSCLCKSASVEVFDPVVIELY